MKHSLIFSLFLVLSFHVNTGYAQKLQDEFIYSKDGARLNKKRVLIENCKKSFGAESNNKTVHNICECRTNLLNYRFTDKQLSNYARKYREDALNRLVEDDITLKKALDSCVHLADQKNFFDIPSVTENFKKNCKESMRKNMPSPPSEGTLEKYCNCALEVLKNRGVGIDNTADLSNPNSILYNEVAFKCANSYLSDSTSLRDWKESSALDVVGPNRTDTVQLISVFGMHKLRLSIGKKARFWMIDTGASDLLISSDYEKELFEQGVLSAEKYIGEGKYVLADNREILCKKYRLDKLKIGNFEVSNLILASSTETGQFLLGKSLLNKFSRWTIDNQKSILILEK